MLLVTSSLIGLAAPVFCFILHILAYRMWPNSHLVARQKLTAIVILAETVFAVLLAWSLTRSEIEVGHAAVVSLLFGYTYFHWFNMSETARRIRMLVRYVAFGITSEETEAYSADTILNNRLTRLVETGTLHLEGNKYILQRGPLLYATRLILFWRSLFFAS